MDDLQEKEQRDLELQRLAFARGVKYREAHTYQLTSQEIDVAACKEYPGSPPPLQEDGIVWNGTFERPLGWAEYEQLMFEPLPRGWSIIRAPKSPEESSHGR